MHCWQFYNLKLFILINLFQIGRLHLKDILNFIEKHDVNADIKNWSQKQFCTELTFFYVDKKIPWISTSKYWKALENASTQFISLARYTREMLFNFFCPSTPHGFSLFLPRTNDIII